MANPKGKGGFRDHPEHRRIGANPTGKGGFRDHPEHRKIGGAPRKGTSIAEAVRGFLDQVENAKVGDAWAMLPRKILYVMLLWEQAKAGKPWAFRLLANYHDGLPPQSTEVPGHSIDDLVSDLQMTDDELKQAQQEIVAFVEQTAKKQSDDGSDGDGSGGDGSGGDGS